MIITILRYFTILHQSKSRVSWCFHPKNCLARPDLPDLPDLDLWPHGPPSQGSRRHGRRWDSGHLGMWTDDWCGSPWITMDHQAQQIQILSRSVEYLSVDHYVVIVVQIDCDCIDCLSVCVHLCFNIVRSCRVRYLRNNGTAFRKAVPAREGSGAVEGRPNLFFGSASLRWQKRMRVSKCMALQHRWNATLESDAHSTPNPSCKYKRPVST